MARTESLAPRSSRKGTSRPARIALGALGFVVVVAAVAAAAGWYLLVRPDHDVAPGTPVEVVIEGGTSSAQIASELSEAGVVDNALMFRLQARQLKADSSLKSGTFSLTTGMTYEAAIAKLVKGPDIVTYDVTIPEGFNTRQVAARFASQAGISEPEFLELATKGAAEFEAEHPYLSEAYEGSLEGYLFPLTYSIKEGTSARDVIEMMLDGFDAQIAGVDLAYAKERNLTLHDVVTIASILEREVNLDKEYPLVSSVLYNRLRQRMRLQLDSTVFYGLPDGTKVLTQADLQNGHPHNTYSNYGLPPGALGNPGLKAIEAAAHPADTDYLYYVLTGKDGSQTFTTNYEDHLKAVEVYRKLIAK